MSEWQAVWQLPVTDETRLTIGDASDAVVDVLRLVVDEALMYRTLFPVPGLVVHRDLQVGRAGISSDHDARCSRSCPYSREHCKCSLQSLHCVCVAACKAMRPCSGTRCTFTLPNGATTCARQICLQRTRRNSSDEGSPRAASLMADGSASEPMPIIAGLTTWVPCRWQVDWTTQPFMGSRDPKYRVRVLVPCYKEDVEVLQHTLLRATKALHVGASAIAEVGLLATPWAPAYISLAGCSTRS